MCYSGYFLLNYIHYLMMILLRKLIETLKNLNYNFLFIHFNIYSSIYLFNK